MRFLLDENLPIGLGDVLREFGHEADHVKLLGLATAPDTRIWAHAVATGAVLVTKDSDFGRLAGRGARVLRLRIGNSRNAELYDLFR